MLSRYSGLVQLRPSLCPRDFLVTHLCCTIIASLQALGTSVPLLRENCLVGVRTSPHELGCCRPRLCEWHGLAGRRPWDVVRPLERHLGPPEDSLRVPQRSCLTVLEAVPNHVIVENLGFLGELPIPILPGCRKPGAVVFDEHIWHRHSHGTGERHRGDLSHG